MTSSWPSLACFLVGGTLLLITLVTSLFSAGGFLEGPGLVLLLLGGMHVAVGLLLRARGH